MRYWLYLHSFALSLFILGYYIQSSNICLSSLNRLQYSVYISRGAGLTLSVFMTLNIIINLKYSLTFLRQFRMFSFLKHFYPQHAVKIHKDLTGIIIVYAIIHSVSHYFNFYTAEKLNISTMFNIHYKTYGGITGHIMITFMFLLVFLSIKFFRKNWFNNIFKRFHNLYYIVFIAFIFHSRGCFVKTNDKRCLPYYSIYHFSFAFIVFLAEKSIRFFKPKLQLYDVFYYKDCFRLIFKKTFSYRAGQYILLRAKGGGMPYEYHPFTIVSHPDIDNDISVYIKQAGDWTVKLRDNIELNETMEFFYDGPFSSPSELSEKSCIIVATGIGITPYISFINEIAFKYPREDFDIKFKCQIIWIVKRTDDISWFKNIFSKVTRVVPANVLDIKIFLTEKFQEERGYNLTMNSLERVNNMQYKIGIDLFHGRPVIKNIIFDSIVRTYVSDTTIINVFCCSIKAVKNETYNACKTLTNKSCIFNFIEEPFL